MQIANFPRTSRLRWPLRLGALALSVAVVAGFAGIAHADPTTVSATADVTYGYDNTVNAVGYLGNTVYAGGIFANAVKNGKLTPRAGLGAIDSSTGALLPWAPTVNGPVNALVVDESTNTIYIAGGFTQVNGVKRDGVAQLDATTGALTPFSHSITGTARTLSIGAGRIFLGGSFTAVDGVPASYLAAFVQSTGARDTSFKAVADDTVFAVSFDPVTSRLYIGGKFHSINGAAKTGKLAAVSSNGTVVTSFKSAVAVLVRDITFGPNTVYAALGGAGGRAVAYSLTGAVLWQATTDGDTQAVAYMNGVVYIGGHFDNACKTPIVAAVGGTCIDGSISRVKFMAVDAVAGTLLPWDPHSSGVHGVLHYALNLSTGKLAAGGEFSTVGGVYQKKFAQFSP